jgi:hypothetical protein
MRTVLAARCALVALAGAAAVAAGPDSTTAAVSARPDSALKPAAVSVNAADTLVGPLPKIVTAAGGPYLVLGDIVVPQGQTVIVEPGVVLLFAGFTGLKVQGTLLARGESDRPIVFTSVNDQAHNPQSTLKAAPYDWNGIQITEDGIGSHLAFCAIRYSVYGLASMTRYIRIGPSLFQFNGRANLTIEGVEHQVGDEPYEYNMTAPRPEGGDSLTILPDPNARKRAIVRYSGLGVLFVGAIMSSVYSYRFGEADDRLDALSTTEVGNLSDNTGADWEAAHDDARRSRAGLVWGLLIGTAGAVGFGWSFFF